MEIHLFQQEIHVQMVEFPLLYVYRSVINWANLPCIQKKWSVISDDKSNLYKTILVGSIQQEECLTFANNSPLHVTITPSWWQRWLNFEDGGNEMILPATNRLHMGNRNWMVPIVPKRMMVPFLFGKLKELTKPKKLAHIVRSFLTYVHSNTLFISELTGWYLVYATFVFPRTRFDKFWNKISAIHNTFTVAKTKI